MTFIKKKIMLWWLASRNRNLADFYRHTCRETRFYCIFDIARQLPKMFLKQDVCLLLDKNSVKNVRKQIESRGHIWKVSFKWPIKAYFKFKKFKSTKQITNADHVYNYCRLCVLIYCMFLFTNYYTPYYINGFKYYWIKQSTASLCQTTT